MSIEKIFNKKTDKDKKYVGSFQRSLAATIDVWIVLFLRIITMQILGSIWMNQAILEFSREFNKKFGTETMKNTQEHIDFIINHKVFAYSLIFYAIVIMVGAVYHAYLNSSAWNGTIGKRFMKIIIIKQNELPLKFGRGLMHYFLSVLPFVFVVYLVSFQIRTGLTFFEAVTASPINIFLGIIFVLWVQIHLFTKNKTTAYDLICNTITIKGKTSAKWPWSK